MVSGNKLVTGSSLGHVFAGSSPIAQGRNVTAEQFLIQSLNMTTFWIERRLMAHNKRILAQA
jgi:hypothetical protein